MAVLPDRPKPKASTHREVDRVKTRRNIEEWLRKQATEEDMVQIADERGIKIAYVQQEQNERPCFGPNQVRCRHQLKEGDSYFEMRSDGTPIGRFTILREPYQEMGSLWINVKYDNNSRQVVLVAHGGIDSYKNGSWEKMFYTIFAGKVEPCHHPDCQHSCPNCS